MADSIKIIKLNIADYARLRAARPDPIEIKGKMYAWDDSVVYVNADTDEVFAQEQISLDALSATVSTKADIEGGSQTNQFGWKLNKDGFILKSVVTTNDTATYKEVFSVKKDGKVAVSGNLYVGDTILDKSAVKATELKYALTSSQTVVPDDSLFIYDTPTWTAGQYIWQRLRSQYIDGTFGPATKSCIQGAKGETGEQGIQGIQGIQGEKGDAGTTPHVGENGNWWIGTLDTRIKAAGTDGSTPFIGTNGNWWIGTTDTGVKAEGKSPYYISIENDFDSIPCSSAGIIPATYDWGNETKHTITILKGTTQQTFNVVATGTTLTNALTLVYEPENVTYVPGTSVLSVTTYSAHITGISANVGCVNYKLYFEKKLVGVGKFEASKAFSGEDAVDYKLVSSAKEIKVLKSTEEIDPASITFNFYKQTGQSNYSTYNGYYGYKIDNGTETFGQAESLTLTSQTHYTKNNTVINVILYQDATHTKKYDTETVFILKDGEDGEKGDPGENAPVIVSVLPYYALGIDETTAPTTGWALTPPTYESGKYYWYKEITTYDNETTTESTPVPHKGLNGSYALAQGKSTTTWSVFAPDNPKTGDCWFDKANDLLKQWNGTAWEDIGDELVAKKVTAEYINSKHITAEKISVVQGENKIFEADGLNPTGGTVMIGGFNVDNKSIHTGTFDPADPGITGVYVGTDGIYLGKKFSVNASGRVIASDLTLTGYATDDDVATAKSEAITTAANDATTKANAAKSEAINTAAEDATTKANAAQTAAEQNASNDATTKANAAQANAVNIAASDATSKANSAKSDAISVAAEDATSKADAAKSAAELNAKSYTDTTATSTLESAKTHTNTQVEAEKSRAESAESALDTKAQTGIDDAAEAQTAADNAYSLAQGKNTTTYSYTEPTSPKEGDCWFDTANKTLKQYTNSTWQDIGGDLVASKVTAEYVNALDITAATINVPNKFFASTTAENVTIGGFRVSSSSLESDTITLSTSAIRIGSDNLVLSGNSSQSTVTSAKNLLICNTDKTVGLQFKPSSTTQVTATATGHAWITVQHTTGTGEAEYYVHLWVNIPSAKLEDVKSSTQWVIKVNGTTKYSFTITVPAGATRNGDVFYGPIYGNLTDAVSIATSSSSSGSSISWTASWDNPTSFSGGTLYGEKSNSSAVYSISHFAPSANGSSSLGLTGNKWQYVYANYLGDTSNKISNVYASYIGNNSTTGRASAVYTENLGSGGVPVTNIYATNIGASSFPINKVWATNINTTSISATNIQQGGYYMPSIVNSSSTKYKIYVWTYTSNLGADATASCLSSTHGCSTVIGAVACSRNTGDLSNTYHMNYLSVYINGSTVTVGNDNGTAKNGFYCIIVGY